MSETQTTKAVELRAHVLGAQDIAIAPVEIPEWGVTMHVKMMTVAERQRFEEKHIVERTKWARERLMVATVCDAEGNLVFGPDDIPILSTKNSKAADRLFDAAMRHNGILAEDVESLKKNSAPTPSNASSSS